jgi:hypothetical protein
MNTSTNERPRTRRFPWRGVLAVAVCALVVWLVHPPVLSWLLRLALSRAASNAGLQLEVGAIRANLAQPIVFEGVRVRTSNAEESQTAVDAARVEISPDWPWHAIFGGGRWFRSLIVEDVRGVLDLRPGARSQRKPVSAPSGTEENVHAQGILRWLPEYIAMHRANVEFVAPGQSYYFEGVSVDFSEARLGAFRATGAELHAGSLNQSLGSLKGVTAWKGGTMYLASVDLWDGVRLDSFEAQLARPEGIALGVQATLFGGSLRCDVSFGLDKGAMAIDSAVWGSNLEVAPLAALWGFHGMAEGVVREARLAFHGSPERALDGQAWIRFAADGFRWKKRGWESLEVGAQMIHRRLAVSDFVLKQKENVLTGNGEFSLDQGWLGIAHAPFLLNASASIKDLGALAGLFGPPFDQMSGRMSLSGSINGQEGRLGGFLSLEGSEMGFRKHPFEAGKLEVIFSNSEAQITRCEFWSGADFLRAKGTVEISAAHNYSGEIQARIQDIAGYRDFFQGMNVPDVRAGAAQIRWQGDGTVSAHSGAFNVSLDKFVSDYTPGGVTGRFGGTYSPQNVYFSGFELEHGMLLFSTRATLARSGITLDDALLRAGGRELAEAEIYLPVDPFDLAERKSLKNALHLDKRIYAAILSKEPLSIRELSGLMGHDRPVEGTIRADLIAEGTASALNVDGKIEAQGLSRKFKGGSSPPSQVHATIRGSDGVAFLTGELASPGLSPITFKAESPFGIVMGADGRRHWINPEGRISASLEVPKVDLAILRPLFPAVQRMAGLVSGGLSVSGTVSKPLLDGRFDLSDGHLEISSETPVLSKVSGSLAVGAGGAQIENLRGQLGGGQFELRGGLSLESFSNPHYDLFFLGDKIELARLPWLQLEANVNLRATGDNGGGMIKGDVRFDGGRFSRRLEVTPILAASIAQDEVFVAPKFESVIPPPFRNWKIDVSLANGSPFLFSGSAASGEILLDLQLIGTLASPIPVGQVELKNARAFLPFTTMTIPNGHLEFVEASPWMPLLDVRGTARALDYEVEVYAFGPLNERRLILRSDPPLSQDSLIQLMTTGMAPGVYAGTALGHLSASESLVSSLAVGQKLSSRGGTINSTTNTLQFNPAPSAYPAGRATLHGRFELWRGLSLVNEPDRPGLANGRVTFRLHLR